MLHTYIYIMMTSNKIFTLLVLSMLFAVLQVLIQMAVYKSLRARVNAAPTSYGSSVANFI